MDHRTMVLNEDDASSPIEIDATDDRFLDEERTPDETPAKSLSGLIQTLFALNGLCLSLQSLSLMYIVNTRVAIPVPYLPTYGAIAFLPYSLKPIYGYLSHGSARHVLFVSLLLINGLSLFFTTLIPPGGVFLAFLLAFVRGITDSWAELSLGLALIDHARHGTTQEEYDILASQFQARAATLRNAGSLLGSFITCLLFLGRQLLAPNQTQLSGSVANALLLSTGFLQITGALGSFLYKEHFVSISDMARTSSGHSFQPLHQDGEIEIAEVLDEESALVDEERSFPSYSSDEEQSNDPLEESAELSCSNWILVGLLQVIIISIALKTPIVDLTSHMAWKFLIVSLLLSIVIMALAMYSHNWWQKSHQVGLFLILRHTVPSDSMVVASFFYSVFQSSPLNLQILSLVGMAMTTLSSWSYGKLWSKFSSGREFKLLIAGTTILGAIASLSNLIMVKQSSSQFIFWIALLVKSISTFCGEWAFLPDVIVATTSLSVKQYENWTQDATTSSSANGKEASKKIGVEYGTLVSCIDFGDQIGSLLTGPIVAMFGISRENEWKNLDHLIILCSGATVMSLGLLKLLNNNRR